jgi:transposase
VGEQRAVRRFIEKLGGPEGLAVCYEAGPGGYQLHRLLTRPGVACDVIAPSLIPIRAGDRVKTDRRDAKKLVRLYRAGELVFVQPPSPEQEGLRDLVRCRDDLRRSRTAARHRISKQPLRHGHIYRDGKSWTVRPQTWIFAQRLAGPLAQAALEHMLGHLAATRISPRSTGSSSGSPAASRSRSGGCARFAGSRPGPISACWPRSATFAGSPPRAS